MAELVTIPISFFELTIDYESPAIKLLMDRAGIIQGVFEALKPWNPGADDIEAHTTGKNSEQGVTFKLPLKRVAFFVGMASCRLTRDDVDWGAVEETTAILDAALSTLTRLGGISIAAQRASVSLHIQPRTMPFMELLNPFVSPHLAGLENEPIKTMAAVAKWGKRKVTIDGSGAVANGVFLRFEREFERSSTHEEMAHQLWNDERELFKILGVEEDRG